MSSLVVGVRDGLEPLLASRVPDLKYFIPRMELTWSLTVFPVKSKVLILKSTPIVGKKLSLKTLSENLNSNDDLPTAELPMRSSLNK
jgi:hypothetical protein